jgi:hypothetical protein
MLLNCPANGSGGRWPSAERKIKRHMCKITVFLSEQGLCPFSRADRLIVYARRKTGWTEDRDIKLFDKPPASIGEQRRRIEWLLTKIDDSRILVGQEISGIAYVVFDKAHFHIFQINQLSDPILDALVREVQRVERKKTVDAEKLCKATPVKINEAGVYRLDLMKIQQEFPDITSKQALKGFLTGTAFSELHLHCRHTPPWIERDRHFTIEERPATDHTYIVVKPK